MGSTALQQDLFSPEPFLLPSAQDGLLLDGLLLKPQTPVAILQVAHGMCEHKERYLPFLRSMADLGFLCVIHDHRGHGKSAAHPDRLGFFYGDPGKKGSQNGGPALVKDLHQVTRYVRLQYPDLPFLLFGHSMGSLAVRSYLKHYEGELDGLVVCGSPSKNPLAGPAIHLVQLLAAQKGGGARSPFINQLFSASFERPFRSEGRPHAWICSDPEVVERYNASPLCNFTFTLNGYHSLLWLMADAYSKKGWSPARPGLPILFVSGEQDPCMITPKHFQGSVDFLRSLGYRNVTSRLCPGMRHEILNEPGRSQVFDDIGTFLLSCLKETP